MKRIPASSPKQITAPSRLARACRAGNSLCRHSETSNRSRSIARSAQRPVILAGQGAVDFAAANGIATLPQGYFQEGWNQHGTTDEPRYGTVGAVARDGAGNLAAATSTGGQKGKLPGRVGDSPLIGAGNYADNAGCAVSCTGWGEDFIRTSLAAYLNFLVGHQGLAAQAVARLGAEHLVEKVNGNGGFILVDRAGDIATAQSSTYLHCGWIEHGGQARTARRSSIRITRAGG